MITELIQWVVTNLWGPPIIELTGPWVEMVGPWVQSVCTKLGELPII